MFSKGGSGNHRKETLIDAWDRERLRQSGFDDRKYRRSIEVERHLNIYTTEVFRSTVCLVSFLLELTSIITPHPVLAGGCLTKFSTRNLCSLHFYLAFLFWGPIP